ncbi:MAG TPA: competence/damage-inducible protein A [Vicinamibacterales bacterium]|nr:competence/damage-inducible protein A [Vicinamibacterales bacterium]
MTTPALPVLARASIVAVGSELLETTRLDTNSLFITEQLNAVGIDVVSKHVAGDDRTVLGHVLRSALEGMDLLVVCGGLGPTDDDLTREAVADVLGRPLAKSAALVEHLERRYASRGLSVPMPLNNLRQAMVPAGADVIDNPNGSAPGLWIDHGAQTVVLLPGPPRELKPMMTALAESRLRTRASGVAIVRRMLRIAGRFESHVDQALHPLYEDWAAASPPVSATILASLGQIELHLSVRHASRERAEAILDRATTQALGVIGEDVFSTDGRRLEEVVGEALAERGLWIAAAESCTGGLLTSRLTDVAGSSRYVGAAIVAYANDAKMLLLGVPETLLAGHGAVSEPVARAMAEGIRTRAGADLGVGITGIAGPGGGTPDKPVGTVAVALASAGGTSARTFRFFGDRELVKFQASQAALDMVRRHLKVPPSPPASRLH